MIKNISNFEKAVRDNGGNLIYESTYLGENKLIMAVCPNPDCRKNRHLDSYDEDYNGMFICKHCQMKFAPKVEEQ